MRRHLIAPYDTLPAIADSLHAARRELPTEAPDTMTVADLNWGTFGSRPARIQVTYELRARSGLALAELSIVGTGAERRVVSIHVTRLARPLEEANAFTLAGKGVGHWVALLIALAVAGFSAVSAVQVARTRGMPNRWWWTFAACWGFGSFVFNWSSGAVGTYPIAIHFLGVTANRLGLMGPWLLSISFPVGAVLAMERRQHHLRVMSRTRVAASEAAAGAAGDAGQAS